MQGGWQPYSVRVGDRWVSYQRFDPLSLLAGVAADFVEAGKSAKGGEADKLATHLTLGIAKNLTSKTWLSGAADFFQMLDDPDRYGDRYFRNLVATAAVPSIINQTAQAIDPNLRDARTLVDAMKARTPGLSQSVPLRRDMWGQPLQRGDAVGPDLISPIASSKIAGDPLRAEVMRLRAPVSQPQREVMVAGERVPLNAEQYDEYQRLSGSGAYHALNDAVRSPGWRLMSDAERTEYIRSVFGDARRDARGQLMADHPEIGAPPALPPGYSAGRGQPLPAPRRRDVSKPPIPSGLPPLPPGFHLTR